MMVRLDSSEGHLIRNRKDGPGRIYYSRRGALNVRPSNQYIYNFSRINFSPVDLSLHFLYFTIHISVDSRHDSLYILDVI